jgi:hypothetical protein
MKKLIATLTLAAAAAACSAQTPVTPGAQPSGTPSPSPSSVPTSSTGTTQVTIYYLAEGTDDMFLTPERPSRSYSTAPPKTRTTPFPSRRTRRSTPS